MQRVEHSFKAMGGPGCLRLEADDKVTAETAIAAAVAEVERLEDKYSRYRDNSLTSQINRAAGTGTSLPRRVRDAAWLDEGCRRGYREGVERRWSGGRCAAGLGDVGALAV